MSLKHIQLEQMCPKGEGYQDQNSSDPHLELDLQALLNTQQKISRADTTFHYSKKEKLGCICSVASLFRWGRGVIKN